MAGGAQQSYDNNKSVEIPDSDNVEQSAYISGQTGNFNYAEMHNPNVEFFDGVTNLTLNMSTYTGFSVKLYDVNVIDNSETEITGNNIPTSAKKLKLNFIIAHDTNIAHGTIIKVKYTCNRLPNDTQLNRSNYRQIEKIGHLTINNVEGLYDVNFQWQ